MANVSVSNTTGLYVGGGSTPVLTNAQTLLSLLSNNGGVTFSLDPAYSNLKVEAFGSNYSNVNVADFLANYGGTINSDLVFNPNIVNLGSQGTVQMQYDPTGTYDPYAIDGGSWLYLDSSGVVFESNVTGTVKSVVFDNNGNITATGNVSGSSFNATGKVTATGNITTSQYFIGNGSQLTGLPATYSNANVASYLPTYTGNLVSLQGNVITTANVQALSFVTTGTSGNISGANYVFANYFVGNGSFLTSLTGANVSGTVGLATYVTGNAQSNITSVGTLSSLTVTGNVTSSGNVSGNYFLGNGAFITGLPAGNYSNANVASYLASNSAVTILTTANITSAANVAGNYILGNAAFMTGIPTGNYSNVNVAAYLPVYTGNMVSMTGNVITTANITGNYFIGNGSALRSITGANVTGTVGLAQFVTGNAQANITSVGTLSSLTVTGNVTSSGNVSGVYFLGNGSQLTGLPATYGNANVAAYLPTYTGNLVSLTGNVITTANVTGAYFLGNGSQLTGVQGNYSNVNVAAYLPTYTGNVGAGNVNIVGTGAVYTPTVQATGSGGLALKNASGTTQFSVGGGGGNNVTFSVATNINPTDAAVVISPTGLGTTTISPGTAGSMNNMVIGNTTPAAANVTTLGASGNITVQAGSYYIGDGSQLTGVTGNYSNVNVAAYLPTYTGNLQAGNIQVLQNTTINGNIVSNPVNLTTIGNLNQISGNTYIGSDATLFQSTTVATGSAGFAAQAPMRFGGQYTVTGNTVAQFSMLMAPNVSLGRPNTNNNARVRPMQISGVFDANGNPSTIGLSPFSGTDSTLVTPVTRNPAIAQNMALWNSQGPSGTAVTITSAAAQLNLLSMGQTSSNLTLTYGVAVNGVVGISANTNQIQNATAFRADFYQTVSNSAVIANRLALECVDPTANIKIAGNIVSTAANLVANGASITGRATITGNVALGGVTALTGYTETVAAASYTSGNVFSPNVQGTTIQTLTLNQNTTINQFTDALPGQSCTLILTQDGTGSRLLTSNMKFAGNSKTLSTAPGAIDIMSVLYDGTTYYASLTTGYA